MPITNPIPAISEITALATASLMLVAANPNRQYLSITNTSDVAISVACGTAAILGSGKVLASGQTWDINVDRQATGEGWKTLAFYGWASGGTLKTVAIFDASFSG